MAAIDFPNSPSNGQEFSADGNVWVYNSTKSTWSIKANQGVAMVRTEITATAGQTSLSVTYNPSYGVDVTVNGVQLFSSDFTAINGTSIAMTDALAEGDQVVVMAVDSGFVNLPSDISDLTDTTNIIPADISDLTDTTNIIPADISDLTDTTSALSSGGATVYATIDDLPLSGVDNGSFALVSATNRLYVWTGSGWFNIALINQTPTITGNDMSYALTNDGTPTVVTLTGTDAEGIPITWSAVTSGNTNVATVTNTDNVFTITPSTDTNDQGTLTVTFRASDGVNIGTATSQFTLVFMSPYWKDLDLSIGTSATNGLDNSTFVDRSTNAHTVTPTGSPVQTAFHPYLENWSNYFDGAGDYLRATDASLAEGTDDFTLECWFWMPSSFSPGLNDSLFAHDTTPGYQISWQTSGFCFMGDGSNRVLNTNTLTTDIFDAWHHIAYARVGDTLYGFLDGNLIGTSTHVSVSTNFTNTTIDIGVNRGGTGYVNAYISNLRIVKGTALYTSTFAPPTEKLTAVSGTVLLTCQSNRFIDNSTNAHSITANGDAKVSAFNPFGQESEYAAGENKGSVHLNGSDQHVNIPDDDDFQLTGDFTLELWMYYRSGAGTYTSVIGGNGSGTDGWNIYITTSNNTLSFFHSAFRIISSTGAVINDKWHHVALTRSGSNTKLFLDGEQVGSTYTGTETYNQNTSNLGTRIGYDHGANGRFNGFISDVKLINGSATYTDNFTPPTAPVGNTGASLYLPFDNAGIYDKTGNHALTLVGDTSTSTTQTKFADTAMYFDGTGDYLEVPSSDLFDDISGGAFTIEGWVRFNTSGNQGVFQLTDEYFPSAVEGYSLNQSTAGVFRIQHSGAIVDSTKSVSSDVWYHFALVRNSSGTLKLFIDGTEEISVTDSTSTPTTHLVIGGYYSTSYLLNGYIENFQILKGVAKYTANFTPPVLEQGRQYQTES